MLIVICGVSMHMDKHMEFQIICGSVWIPDLPVFLEKINAIAAKNQAKIQGLNALYIAGEQHLCFAIKKAFSAIDSGRNVAKDPGIEIMRYAAGERQIEKAFSIGLFEGENQAAFVLLGEKAKFAKASAELGKLISERPCSELLSYSSSKRASILSRFEISEAEIEAAGEEMIPDLVLERVALADFIK